MKKVELIRNAAATLIALFAGTFTALAHSALSGPHLASLVSSGWRSSFDAVPAFGLATGVSPACVLTADGDCVRPRLM